jgi:hypothetical protein
MVSSAIGKQLAEPGVPGARPGPEVRSQARVAGLLTPAIAEQAPDASLQTGQLRLVGQRPAAPLLLAGVGTLALDLAGA